MANSKEEEQLQEACRKLAALIDDMGRDLARSSRMIDGIRGDVDYMSRRLDDTYHLTVFLCSSNRRR